jgi:hypothetical protein
MSHGVRISHRVDAGGRLPYRLHRAVPPVETLVAGNCYFLLGFHDAELRLPMISTLVYERSEIDPDRGRHWLFRELSGGSEPTDSDTEQPQEATDPLVGFTDEDLYQILDFDTL